VDRAVTRLSTGAALRLTNEGNQHAVVCVNGGQRRQVAGTWSASLEWLVGRLAPRFPQLTFGEVRYRIKSWQQLDLCVEDARAAIGAIGAGHTLLLGFSMGGAVAIAAADQPSVERVLGLAPWLPERLDLSPLAGKRLDVLHGSLDRRLPAVPGVSTASSHRGFSRAQALGVAGTYTRIPGGVHGLAVRTPFDLLIPLPRSGAWAQLVAAQLETFVG
jgi:pimeloyl-ACP methyl ester carboxylesterase